MSVDLTTTYLGLELRNPLVVSASPLTADVEQLKRYVDAGAAAAVMPSLFEEQIEQESWQWYAVQNVGAEAYVECQNYFPELDGYNRGPETYLEQLEAARRAVDVPIIGSLNGATPGGWVRYARHLESAGASALELNIYFLNTDPTCSSADLEARYLDLVRSVRSEVTIPVAVKLGPYFSSLPHFARQLEGAGVQGLVLFNRFLQPDFDLEHLSVHPRMVLSSRDELRLPLRWIAILRPHLKLSLAGTSGVHFAEDALKLLLAGADAVMLASALYRHGPEHIQTLLGEIGHWLAAREYTSVRQMQGSMSQANCPDPDAFERANYMKALIQFTRD